MQLASKFPSLISFIIDTNSQPISLSFWVLKMRKIQHQNILKRPKFVTVHTKRYKLYSLVICMSHDNTSLGWVWMKDRMCQGWIMWGFIMVLMSCLGKIVKETIIELHEVRIQYRI